MVIDLIVTFCIWCICMLGFAGFVYVCWLCCWVVICLLCCYLRAFCLLRWLLRCLTCLFGFGLAIVWCVLFVIWISFADCRFGFDFLMMFCCWFTCILVMICGRLIYLGSCLFWLVGGLWWFVIRLFALVLTLFCCNSVAYLIVIVDSF